MQHSGSGLAADSFRRLVLGVMFAIGLAVATAPHTTSVRAAERADALTAQADAPAPTAKPAPQAATPAAPQPPASVGTQPGAAKADADTGKADADDTDTDADDAGDQGKPSSKRSVKPGNHGIFIEEGGRKIRIEGLGRDREYDSFEQFVKDAPALAGLFFVTVMLFFLVPLLIIVLLIWYKLRKNRIANETMLKLAERGVVPPATAMNAIASGTAASVAAAATAPPPSANPAYDQARYLHKRTAWSDLRKGIILSAVGLGLSFWSMLDDGTPNSVGLILLFVGLGYCILWFFEDRTPGAPRTPDVPPPPGSA